MPAADEGQDAAEHLVQLLLDLRDSSNPFEIARQAQRQVQAVCGARSEPFDMVLAPHENDEATAAVHMIRASAAMVLASDRRGLASFLARAEQASRPLELAAAALVAGELPFPDVVPLLTRGLTAEELPVRAAAILGAHEYLIRQAGIGRPLPSALVEVLLAIAGGEEPEPLRVWAIRDLSTASAASPRIKEALEGVIGHATEPVRAEAALVLAEDSDPFVVSAIADGLGQPIGLPVFIEAAGVAATAELEAALTQIDQPDLSPATQQRLEWARRRCNSRAGDIAYTKEREVLDQLATPNDPVRYGLAGRYPRTSVVAKTPGGRRISYGLWGRDSGFPAPSDLDTAQIVGEVRAGSQS